MQAHIPIGLGGAFAMLLEYFGETDVRLVQLFFGLGLGLLFGIAAQISRFCLRRSIVGDDSGAASAVWLTAFATAIGGFFLANIWGLVDVADHRLLSADLPIAAIVIGGLAFGAGMVLSRGCVSRLTVLSGTGNLRALTVLAIFAITAYAALKGVLAPLRVSLGQITVPSPMASLSQISGLAPLLALVGLGAAFFIGRRFQARATDMILGGLIGLIAVAGWAGTSSLLLDDFDPLPVQSAAFTLPWSDTLFWIIASSAVPAGFGTGLIGGVLTGSFLSAFLRRELRLQSFETPIQTMRYVFGGMLMGVGGVLAGGCTVGAGLSGSAMLSIASLLALFSIIAGAALTHVVLEGRRAMVPAE